MTGAHVQEIAAVVGALTVLVGAITLVGRKVRRVSAKLTAAADAVLGREAIIDPITGVEIAPALPGIGVRMAETEKTVATIAEALATLTVEVTKLAGNVVQITDLLNRVTRVEESLLAHVNDQKAHRGGPHG